MTIESCLPMSVMRRLLAVSLGALELGGLHGSRLQLNLLHQAVNGLGLLNDHFIQLLHLMLQVGHVRFQPGETF